jgi:glutaminase
MASAPTAATRQIFAALDVDGSGTVSSSFFVNFLARNGLIRTDKRLEAFFGYLESLGAVAEDKALTLEQFNEATATCRTLIDKCITGKLRIPDFESFVEVIKHVYATVEPNKSGANASYIPQLAEVDPEQFGISVTTVDGQQFSIGDTEKQFCIQSCSKPLSYLIAQKQFGPEYVHNHVGCEPSGRAFNEMCLKPSPTPENKGRQIPHNPCINAGAIMTVSMVQPDAGDRAARLAKVLEVWRRLSADTTGTVGYDDETYKSESGSADRNWCLGYMMKESGAFPPCFSDLGDTLELYFQICSILNTNSAMSIMASTLANGGLNPISGDRVFAADHVRNVLPVMLSAGMYDYSGQWAYDIGVPAKSGVGGCVFVVVPNVCGISFWSPRLDSVGNSARGVHGATELVKLFQFHNFEVFSGLSRTKIDPTMRKNAGKQAALGELLFAASQGDVAALSSQAASGIDLYEADYDSRTALHLASSEGHADAVAFLIEHAPADTKIAVLSAKDRWGGTPLADAVQNGNEACIKLLRDAGATGEDGASHGGASGDADSEINVSDDAPVLLSAAADGDVDELIKLKAGGHDLTIGDYDCRTALHLAASNGHTKAVTYLLAQAGDARAKIIAAKDRFGGTPHDDAVREGHTEVAQILA